MSVSTIDPITALTRDLKKAAATLGDDEVRYLVDAYYQQQENRKASENQIRSMEREPHEIFRWLSTNTRTLENNIKTVLDRYTDSNPVGQWSKSIVGIGPVIAAGLLAHIDLEPWKCAVHEQNHKEQRCKPDKPHGPACRSFKIETVSHIWSFAGLNPAAEWAKGQKRPWNASLKTLCWKIGESFVKVSGNPKDYYGKVWAKRKELEAERNASGEYADQAAAILEKRKIGKTSEAYKAYSKGMLPPGHIHARAKRYAVKLFLAHWHDVAYREHFGKAPPAPYPIAHLGHAHEIAVPASTRE